MLDPDCPSGPLKNRATDHARIDLSPRAVQSSSGFTCLQTNRDRNNHLGMQAFDLVYGFSQVLDVPKVQVAIAVAADEGLAVDRPSHTAIAHVRNILDASLESSRLDFSAISGQRELFMFQFGEPVINLSDWMRLGCPSQEQTAEGLHVVIPLKGETDHPAALWQNDIKSVYAAYICLQKIFNLKRYSSAQVVFPGREGNRLLHRSLSSAGKKVGEGRTSKHL